MEVGEGEDLGKDQDIAEGISDIPGLIPVHVDESRGGEPPSALAADTSISTPAPQGSEDVGIGAESSTAMNIIPPEEEDWMHPI